MYLYLQYTQLKWIRLSLSLSHVYFLTIEAKLSQIMRRHTFVQSWFMFQFKSFCLPWVSTVAEFLFQKLTLMTFISGIVHQKLAQNPCHSVAFGGQQSLAVSFGGAQGAQGELPQMIRLLKMELPISFESWNHFSVIPFVCILPVATWFTVLMPSSPVADLQGVGFWLHLQRIFLWLVWWLWFLRFT